MRWFIKNTTTKFFSVCNKGMSLKSEEEQKTIRRKVNPERCWLSWRTASRDLTLPASSSR
jgi:hypothetical protein